MCLAGDKNRDKVVFLAFVIFCNFKFKGEVSSSQQLTNQYFRSYGEYGSVLKLYYL